MPALTVSGAVALDLGLFLTASMLLRWRRPSPRPPTPDGSTVDQAAGAADNAGDPTTPAAEGPGLERRTVIGG